MATALVVAGCGTSEATIASEVDPSRSDATTTTDGTATTEAPFDTTEPPENPEASEITGLAEPSSTEAGAVETPISTIADQEPGVVAELLQLQLEDFPPGYELSTDVSYDDLCDGVPNVNVAFPPLAETSHQFVGDHLHGVDIAVYESPEAAVEAFRFAEMSLLGCNGVLTTDDDGTRWMLQVDPVAAPSVQGTDRLIGYINFLSSSDRSMGFDANLGVVDSVMFWTVSTDYEVVSDITSTVLARYRGDDSPAAIEPNGQLEPWFGLSDSQYYSWTDAGAELRGLSFPSEDVNRFFGSADDDRINELASAACAAVAAFEIGGDIEATIRRVFTTEEMSQYGAYTIGEVFAASVSFYCPVMLEVLQQLAAGQGQLVDVEDVVETALGPLFSSEHGGY